MIMLAMLAGGVSAGGCAPALDGNGERGVTIHRNLLVPGADVASASAMANQHCSQFGRFAHLGGEVQGWLWSDTLSFDCVD